MTPAETIAFNQGAVFAFAEVIRNCGNVESAFDAAGFSDEEIAVCAEFDVSVIRDELNIPMPQGCD
ncbi:hypothetical protein LCGC14_1410400 [marine sediment metagenome]|uniref:Uncharacterized protein n=1 Tax=marine sediment metagenome TaxID=412755 RepID=A0A0F9MW39_9ZZZZ